MFKVSNLSASIGDKSILEDINIEMAKGEVLLVTGHNGSGKSTLLHTIMGRADISAQGKINLHNLELTELECHDRAQQGVFMFHQTPPTIDGVNTMTLFKEIHKAQKLTSSTGELIKEAKYLFAWASLPAGWEKRAFNQGASGGERKKNELAQAVLLKGNTTLLLLDEPDSGLEQSSRQKIIDLINDTVANQGYVLLVTHDKELQERYSNNKLELSNGRRV